MIPPDRLILLDTNVLLHLVRRKAAGKWIEETYRLVARPEKPLISIVSVGELFRIASRKDRKWGAARHRTLQQLMHEMVIVDISEPGILPRYGEIGAYLDDTGKPIQQNDVWIAATTAVKDAVLLTTDKDFDRLHPQYVEREFIDPRQLPQENL